MIDSKTWLLNELDMTEEELYSPRRDKYSEKRWVMMWFYRVAGKSYPQIARIIRHDHSTCRHGCVYSPASLKRYAEELFCRYMTEVRHEPPDFKLTVPEEKPKVTIKVPDYHQNITKFIEVDKDSIKPQRKIRKWDL